VHRTVFGAQASQPGEHAASLWRCGYNSPDCPVCTGLSDVSVTRLANGRQLDQWMPRVSSQRSPGRTGLSGAPPDCPVCHGVNGWQQSPWTKKERNQCLFTVQCAPDCPVHPRTEGNQFLPIEEQTTPLALGAIKGPPWRMEQYTKHSFNI
jgi:hypothetical protein